MYRKIVSVSLLLTAIAMLLSGCGQKTADVTVTLQDFTIEALPASAPANTPIRFTVTNNGTVTHEVVLQLKGSNDEPLEADGKESEVEDVEPGQTKTFEWTVTEAGDYQLACYEPEHFEKGMFTDFTVTK